jgi:MFS family permease
MMVCLLTYSTGCLNGYDGSLMGGLNGMTSYQEYFHMTVAGSSTGLGRSCPPQQARRTSTVLTFEVFAMYNIGSVAAVFFTGPVNDTFGRRWGMFLGSLIVIIGTCVQAPSTTKHQFLAGRFVLGFGVSFCCVSAPTYVSEMVRN